MDLFGYLIYFCLLICCFVCIESIWYLTSESLALPVFYFSYCCNNQFTVGSNQLHTEANQQHLASAPWYMLLTSCPVASGDATQADIIWTF